MVLCYVKEVLDLPSLFPLSYWEKMSNSGLFPEEFWRECGRRRLPGFLIPATYGGLGKTVGELVEAVIYLTMHGCGTALYPLLSNNMSSLVINKSGTEKQRQRLLPRLASGEYIMGLSITEKESGSDVLSIKTTAVKQGGKYVINGEKMYVNNFDRATHMLLAARTTPLEHAAKKSLGLTLFVLDMKAGGLSFSELPKMGTNYFRTGVMRLENVEVDEENVVGEVDNGWKALAHALNPDRIVYAAVAVGSALFAIKTATSYASERKVFGKPIGAYQGIQFPLASLYTETEAARLLTLDAAAKFDRGEDASVAACLAKYFASEVVFKAVGQAVQVLGGYGYLKESGLERVLRDIYLLRSGPITQELALAFIAEKGLGLPRSY
ncbi:acyl-CoA dehydrogenase [Candidatus Caldarchaeum subterraneum]|uniref:Acyl-CoA dehydrogenase n=2 Tax=Caldiarchaeum subterraneum TaxID=311458 RepID=E6N4U2_CALS0|nr:acyl-CoA dehydrogenase [Candidatus Caldarchaeum subterraneum]BAJ50107.1 acyl-CoA dehydrogenase [Candidatus Caldarchaeum subterraneum]